MIRPSMTLGFWGAALGLLALPVACSGSECSGPGGLCISPPQGNGGKAGGTGEGGESAEGGDAAGRGGGKGGSTQGSGGTNGGRGATGGSKGGDSGEGALGGTGGRGGTGATGDGGEDGGVGGSVGGVGGSVGGGGGSVGGGVGGSLGGGKGGSTGAAAGGSGPKGGSGATGGGAGLAAGGIASGAGAPGKGGATGCLVNAVFPETCEQGAGGEGGASSDGGCPAGSPGVGGEGGGGGLTLLPIDDLEDGDLGTYAVLGASGGWFAANGGDGQMFPSSCVVSSDASDLGSHSSNYAMHTYGAGFPWGSFAQVGISLKTGSDCAGPVDVRDVTGVRFWMRGSSTGVQSVRFMVATVDTNPPETGGTCAYDCYRYYTITLTVGAQWTEYYVNFDNLVQQGNTLFNRTGLLNLIWEGGANGVASCFDYWVDDVAFFRDR